MLKPKHAFCYKKVWGLGLRVKVLGFGDLVSRV